MSGIVSVFARLNFLAYMYSTDQNVDFIHAKGGEHKTKLL